MISITERFIISPPELMIDADERLVILVDYLFWGRNIDKLTDWCIGRNVTHSGMVLVFGDDITLTEFVLRWS